MLTKQISSGLTFNEILLGSTEWKAQLPNSVMGFFYPSSCGKPCIDEVTAVFTKFKAAYPKSNAPLLELEITSHKSPFNLISK
jgi:hypothetical protein